VITRESVLQTASSTEEKLMADGYDRFDNEGGGGGSFVMGLLTGTVLGAGLGMLFAPKSGSELRNQVAEQAGNLANTASEGYRRASEAAGGWAEKGREAYDKARDAVNRGADEAQRYVKEATGGSNSGSTSSAGGSGSPGYSSESMRGTGSDPLRGGTGPMSSQPGTPGGTRRS
jgi:gas vesicle protein